ncbi:MAG TPA: orotidine-5'-phosphate decarboxylase, partial [Trueperaceae bacterium]|nr:orotidine-5'-phosphate decarboxylase [Trueperaceae bacterium]
MFTKTLHERVTELDTRVCLGIDPRPGLHAGAASRPDGGAEAVAEYFEHILEATHDLLACCKPQSAFFEALGVAGIEALQRVMSRARSLGVPVLLDAKRGDIASTADAYAAAYLGDGQLSADALTVNGYLGMDSLEPFITSATTKGRGVFVLLKTSNPGSVDIQDLDLASGVKLYQHLGRLLRNRAASLP